MSELAVIGSVAAKIAPKLAGFLLANHKLRAELRYEIEHIKENCSIISAAIEDDGKLLHSSEAASSAHEVWFKIVREFAYDMDDCIDSYAQLMSTAPVSKAWWIRRKAHQLKTVRARNKFAARIALLRRQSDDVSEQRIRYTNLSESQAPKAEAEAETDTALSDAGRPLDEVGMKTAHEELRKLIETPQDQEFNGKLKVISVAGFGGIGKTHLVRHAYLSLAVTNQYPTRAWVNAAKRSSEDVLQDILEQLGMQRGSAVSSSSEELHATLHRRLENKRFFIVIDDMRVDFWVNIKDAFPVAPGVNSRVIITTTNQSIARKSSSSDGHVYLMRTLTKIHAEDLFFRVLELSPTAAPDTVLSSEIIRKCDGLPLALVATAKSLYGETQLAPWEDMGDNLGKYLETELLEQWARMKRVLVRSYASLSKPDIKTCLLYMGIYPSGRPIKRGSMIRRWSAEGFIRVETKKTALQVAIDNFRELFDQSIIQPIDASGSCSEEVKTCQTHGIMLEFILHKSICESFVTIVYDNVPLRSKVRWLCLNNASGARSRINPKDMCHLRSLTIFGEVHRSVFDFSEYKMMRVLDLEECTNLLEDKHLKDICTNMLLLRYLSLRGAAKVTVLPKEIKKLQFLETLDLRSTKIEILPTQAIELPCLVHLFGKFKIQEGTGDKKIGKLQTWLSENNSNLQTAAGFVVDNKSLGFAQLMGHMTQLTKVKIWCEPTTDASSFLGHVSKAIKGFIQGGTNSVDNVSCLSAAITKFIQGGTSRSKGRALSLIINAAWCLDLLNKIMKEDSSLQIDPILETKYYLRSLKLQGNKLSSLPQFVTELGGLTKLCLSFSHLQLSRDVVKALNSVRGLEYLKLIATQLGKLDIRRDELTRLQHLYIAVEVSTELEIQEGAMPDLESLRLLCKNLNGLSGTTILSLPRLKEVALHAEVSVTTKEDFETAANTHPRRPKLLFVTNEMVDDLFKPMRSEAAEGTTTHMLPVVTETVSDSAAEISFVAPATTTTDNNTTLPVNHNANTNAPQEIPALVVTSETASEPHMEVNLAAPATVINVTMPVNHNNNANVQQEHPVEVVIFKTGIEHAVESTHVAWAATNNTMMAMNHDTITNAKQERPGPVDSSEGRSVSANHIVITNAQQNHPETQPNMDNKMISTEQTVAMY